MSDDWMGLPDKQFLDCFGLEEKNGQLFNKIALDVHKEHKSMAVNEVVTSTSHRYLTKEELR